MLLTRFCQDNRIAGPPAATQPADQVQRPLGERNDFVAYVDAIGELDGTPCLLEWKTSFCRYPEEPEGLLALDPQLVCYSWMTGIAEVAQIVFVRKRLVEVQYLRTTITDEQRQEFGHLVEEHGPPNRVRAVSAAQRHPLSAESVQQLSLRRALSWEAGDRRRRAGAASRSERSWLA